MRRMAVTSVAPGMRLAKPIVGSRGELLLSPGMEFTEKRLQLLKARGCFVVYVEDEGTDDIEIVETISHEVRSQGLRAMEKVHTFMQRAVQELPYSNEESAVRAFDTRRFAQATRDTSALEELAGAASSIVTEVLNGEAALGLNSIRLYDNYTFDHSVHVAVAAVMVGKALGLSRDMLEALATGSLLHDTGKVFIDRELVNKPGKLTDEEMATMRQHAQLGYEAVRQIYGPGVISNHIPFQHHERQDGKGYPRGLKGSNRLPARVDERRGAGTIILLAEIASIADVYDALNSDRPYRPALPPDQIIGMMHGMAGTMLNEGIAHAFFKLLAPFPVGSEVMVTGGEYDGFLGVVARQNPPRLERPTVRVLYDQHCRRVEPFDLDLIEASDAGVVATFIPPEGAPADAKSAQALIHSARRHAAVEMARPDVC